jgi:hemerythrin-like domain-containing protein
LKSTQEIEISHLEQVLDFLTTYVDNCHHGKEESLLFPALEAVGISKEGAPIVVMLFEYEEGREYIRNLSEGIAKFKSGDLKAIEVIVENATKYIHLLNQHIDKEDIVLFKMADIHLSEENNKELLEGFEKIEEERIGKGKHENFHKILHQLRDYYLM